MAAKQFTDYTTAQKVTAIAALKTMYKPVAGETDAVYLNRIAQEWLYRTAFNIYKQQQINSITTIT